MDIEKFDQFFERLPISRAVLSDRLSWLIDSGVMEKCPPDAKRGVYNLTDKGLALQPTFMAMREWGDTWLFDANEKHKQDYFTQK